MRHEQLYCHAASLNFGIGKFFGGFPGKTSSVGVSGV